MKKADLALAILFPLLVFVSVFLFDLRISYFTSLMLFFVIPSIYLSLRSKRVVKKVALFSFFISIPMALIFEIVGRVDDAWSVPRSILPYRLFGFIPLEDYLWMFLVTYIILIFYESFCNRKFEPSISKRIRVMNLILYGLAALLVITFIFNKSLLNIPYAYLWFGIILFVIPSTLFLCKYPSFFAPFLKVSAFFFYLHLLFELVGVKLGHWVYEGAHYIGLVYFFDIRFPIEEFFFVILLGGFAACSYYEFFTNKKIPKSFCS